MSTADSSAERQIVKLLYIRFPARIKILTCLMSTAASPVPLSAEPRKMRLGLARMESSTTCRAQFKMESFIYSCTNAVSSLTTLRQNKRADWTWHLSPGAVYFFRRRDDWPRPSATTWSFIPDGVRFVPKTFQLTFTFVSSFCEEIEVDLFKIAFTAKTRI